MESAHIINETVTIGGANIEKVYDDCLSFFKKPWSSTLESCSATITKPTEINRHKPRVHIPCLKASKIDLNFLSLEILIGLFCQLEKFREPPKG